MKLENFRQIFLKILKYQISKKKKKKILSVEAELLYTDRHYEANSRSSYFAERA
jgi:hypothetical protein